MELSPQQDRAAERVSAWLRRPRSERPQVFRLFGCAGTGKTSLAQKLVEDVSGEVYFTAPTGKAAYVLGQKGCRSPMTCHKLIYLPRSKSAARLVEMEEKLAGMSPKDPLRPRLERDIQEERQNLARPAFQLNLDSPLKRAALVVLDEASMVDQQMGEDLLSFGCPILALGDPAQLPPVRGDSFFMREAPDVELTEIHRQARDNPIIRLATMIRNQEMPRTGRYGESEVLPVGAMNQQMAMDADQIIVGRNKTRQAWNDRMRQLTYGDTDRMPREGDRLCCKRNSMEHPFLNGAIWNVLSLGDNFGSHGWMTLESEVDKVQATALVHNYRFMQEDVPFYERLDAEDFDYGYAITAHSSQGSQWRDVLVYDQGSTFGTQRWRWLYTAATRASDRVRIVRPS